MEPVPPTFKALRDNVAINEVSSLVTTLNMGAGKEALGAQRSGSPQAARALRQSLP